MKNRNRLMLVAGVALVGALSWVLTWGTPPPGVPTEREVAEAPPAPVPPPAPQASLKAAPVVPHAEPVPEAPGEQLPPATVVALRPGDVAPEPEVENPPPQENDEIQPELPQTAQWRLEKTTHISALLGRDVERLEREREAADGRENTERVRQLDAMIQRQRGRLVSLREELRTLTEAAAKESAQE